MSPLLRRAVLITLLAVSLWVMPVLAQDPASTTDFPTVAELNSTVIPPRDRVDLAERLRGVSASEIPPTPTSVATLKVGDQQTFTAVNSSDNTSFTLSATLKVVGEHIYLWVQDGQDINLSDLQTLAQAFDTSIYPNVRGLWGSENDPGVDGDPHVYGLFTRGLGSGVAAYFASDNTYPHAVVPVSNQHEMFFFNIDALGTQFPVQAVESVVAHEFQHMIRFNLQINTETWLNEGFSTFTQFYFYQDLNGSVLDFLRNPNTQLDACTADATRRALNSGPATLFLTYFYERYGIDAMRKLSAEHLPRGLQDVDATLAELGQPGVNSFFGDWVLANYLADPNYDHGVYSYPNLPALPQPIAASVDAYPFTAEADGSQYAATYYALASFGGAKSLDIHVSAPTEVNLVPTSVPSGTHFWYSNRGDMGDSRLTHAFDLSNVAHATLNYRLWYDTEPSWDYGYVMVSEDGGKTWKTLSTADTTSDDPHGVTYGPGYTGASTSLPNTQDGWVDETASLDAYAGKQILVRFEMITDDAVTRPGMALANVSIPEIGYTDDFAASAGDWQPEGWIWTDNRLPQSGWVQVAERANGQTTDVERWALDDQDHTVKLAQGVDQVVLAVSPFAPVTTVAMPYTLRVQTGS